jgi:uncharacterized membrane protein
VSDTAREIMLLFHASALPFGILGAGYALYAGFKLRDKPEAISTAGWTLIVFSTLLAKWFDVAAMFVGLGLTLYGIALALRRGGYGRMTDEALKGYGGSNRP